MLKKIRQLYKKKKKLFNLKYAHVSGKRDSPVSSPNLEKFHPATIAYSIDKIYYHGGKV